MPRMMPCQFAAVSAGRLSAHQPTMLPPRTSSNTTKAERRMPSAPQPAAAHLPPWHTLAADPVRADNAQPVRLVPVLDYELRAVLTGRRGLATSHSLLRGRCSRST